MNTNRWESKKKRWFQTFFFSFPVHNRTKERKEEKKKGCIFFSKACLKMHTVAVTLDIFQKKKTCLTSIVFSFYLFASIKRTNEKRGEESVEEDE